MRVSRSFRFLWLRFLSIRECVLQLPCDRPLRGDLIQAARQFSYLPAFGWVATISFEILVYVAAGTMFLVLRRDLLA